jgi:hypothetical protein
MPDLQFHVTGVAPAARGLTPLLQFELEVGNEPASQAIHTAILQVQIQIEPARRHYSAEEKEKLVDLFGEPDRWGQTLRNSLWTHAVTTLRGFSEKTQAVLPVPCTYDLNVSAAKYFFALEDGEVALLFLFSGTVFYEAGGRLQAELIPWSKEARFRMPVRRWREMMDHHYPNCAWVSLRRDVFERLYAFKREHGLTSWEAAIERLLEEKDVPETVPPIQPQLVETAP